ncbi:hypothetical protein TKK_0003933 [Trichogramma kaykai]|uniref:MPN domain-containing protein n=1 Tax=Trichogramma kaykai TaxID=54128 RepID=A0ABD2XN37_9HYME
MLRKVEINDDVYLVCLQHALSTENYEVMGLLIGDHNNGVTEISAAIILRRSEKKKDRVEISPHQLINATSEAEQLTETMGRKMKVVGWYHSHPHITVFPSHVDTNTQQMYQTMDPEFVGLIFSVFTEDKSNRAREVEMTCFQTHNGSAQDIPISINYTSDISKHCSTTMVNLSKILAQEEEDMTVDSKRHPDRLTAIHNEAVQTRALGHVTDIVTRPLLQVFIERLKSNNNRVAYLKNHIEELKKELEDLKEAGRC